MSDFVQADESLAAPFLALQALVEENDDLRTKCKEISTNLEESLRSLSELEVLKAKLEEKEELIKEQNTFLSDAAEEAQNQDRQIKLLSNSLAEEESRCLKLYNELSALKESCSEKSGGDPAEPVSVRNKNEPSLGNLTDLSGGLSRSRLNSARTVTNTSSLDEEDAKYINFTQSDSIAMEGIHDEIICSTHSSSADLVNRDHIGGDLFFGDHDVINTRNEINRKLRAGAHELLAKVQGDDYVENSKAATSVDHSNSQDSLRVNRPLPNANPTLSDLMLRIEQLESRNSSLVRKLERETKARAKVEQSYRSRMNDYASIKKFMKMHGLKPGAIAKGMVGHGHDGVNENVISVGDIGGVTRTSSHSSAESGTLKVPGYYAKRGSAVTSGMNKLVNISQELKMNSDAAERLLLGWPVTQHFKLRFPREREIVVDIFAQALKIRPLKSTSGRSTVEAIALDRVARVDKGINISLLSKTSAKPNPAQCISIVLTDSATVDLELSSVEDRDDFHSGFLVVLSRFNQNFKNPARTNPVYGFESSSNEQSNGSSTASVYQMPDIDMVDKDDSNFASQSEKVTVGIGDGNGAGVHTDPSHKRLKRPS
eukprot:gene733-814_t